MQRAVGQSTGHSTNPARLWFLTTNPCVVAKQVPERRFRLVGKTFHRPITDPATTGHLRLFRTGHRSTPVAIFLLCSGEWRKMVSHPIIPPSLPLAPSLGNGLDQLYHRPCCRSSCLNARRRKKPSHQLTQVYSCCSLWYITLSQSLF